MKDFVNELQSVERLLSKEKGAFNLFALFLREDAPEKWDLLIAAPWVEEDKAETLKRVSKELQKRLSKEELLKLSRVVIIDQSNPALRAFQTIHVEHGDMDIKDRNLFGLQIKHAHIITSRRPEHA